MRKFLLSTICYVSCAGSCFAFHPSQVRFHCEQDSIKIQNLLTEGADLHSDNANKLMLFYGEKLIGTPYVAHTLEGDEECLTINIDEFDCTTFIETAAALTKTTLSNRKSWRDFANNLESLRYRGGNIDGYASRLHYISDWILNNISRDNLKEITNKFPNTTHTVKTLDFMSRNRDKYSALKDNSENLEGIKNVEMGYRSHRYPTLRKTALLDKGVKKLLSDGDIIIILTKIDGLDATHVGMVKMVDGRPYLLHASQNGGKVMLSTDELGEMLRRNRNSIGIRVIRVIE